MTKEEIIGGLQFTVDMFLFDPNTGETYTEPRNDMDKTTIDACKGAIELLEQTRWIPVSERLPESDGDYLLFGKVEEDEENYIFVGEYDSCGEQFGIWEEQFDRTTLGCLGSEFYEYASVLAWMPLPEPYKGENESEECRGCHYNDGKPHAECVLCTKDVAKEEPTIDEVIAEINKQE